MSRVILSQQELEEVWFRLILLVNGKQIPFDGLSLDQHLEQMSWHGRALLAHSRMVRQLRLAARKKKKKD